MVVQPQPKAEEPPRISYSFSGKDDLVNPMVVAMLLHEKKAPSAEEIQQAVALLKGIMPMAEATPPAQPGQPGAAPGGQPPHPGTAPQPPEDYAASSKVVKRSRDMTPGKGDA